MTEQWSYYPNDRYKTELAFRVYESWVSEMVGRNKNDVVIPLPIIELVCAAARVLLKELKDETGMDIPREPTTSS